MPKLDIINIEKTFQGSSSLNSEDIFKLSNINLNINHGEFISILGPSGCGKTTLLKIIAGLIDISHGIILEDGKDVSKIPVEKRNYAMVAQRPLLFPNMTLIENICFGLKMKKIKKAERNEVALAMVNKLKLQGLEKRYPSQLSGGQCQRVAIARALVNKPKVLLMDEPFSALNEELRFEMKELVKEFHRTNNLTTIFVTHDKEEASFLSDRIITMKNGSIE